MWSEEEETTPIASDDAVVRPEHLAAVRDVVADETS